MQKKNHDYSSFCNKYMEICLGVLFSVAMDHEHQRQLRRLLFLSLLKLSSNLFIMISSSFTIVIKNIIISQLAWYTKNAWHFDFKFACFGITIADPCSVSSLWMIYRAPKITSLRCFIPAFVLILNLSCFSYMCAH